MLRTESDSEISVIRGLLQALVIRNQIHGPTGLGYNDYTNERQFIQEARKLVEEDDRKKAIPKDAWTV